MRPGPVATSAPAGVPGRQGRFRLGVAAGAALVTLLLVTAALGPVAAPHRPEATDFEPYRAPGRGFVLGTDHLGRDLLSRVLWGARLSVEVGLLAAGVSVILGALGGLASGLLAEPVDLLAQRLTDILLAVPPLVLALALVAGMGPSARTVVLALILTLAPGMARTLRSVVLVLRQAPFVEAARALGAGVPRVAGRHVLPGLLPTAGTLFTVAVAHAMVVEASLSFLGAGVPADHVSWGSMVTAGVASFERAPWIVLAPGLALTLGILGLTLVGDAIHGAASRRAVGS